MTRPPVTSVSAVGVAAGCAGMVAMLPGAAAGVLGAIGISGSSALARAVSPVAEPLFIVSAVLVIVGALACGRLVAQLSVAGITPSVALEDLHRRRLAGAVWPEQAEEGAVRERQVQVIERKRAVVVALREASNRERRRRGFAGTGHLPIVAAASPRAAKGGGRNPAA